MYLQDRCRQCPRGVSSRPSPQGPGAATPNLPQIFDVLRLIVWRSTAAKPNEVEITFMPRFVGRGILKLICVRDRGYRAGEPSNNPPNMTPIFNEIGTITGAHVSQKRLVRFGNNLHYVIAGAQGYYT